MVKSLLVGLDGTPYSEAAVDLGIRWARSHDALLVGLGIVDEATIMTPAGGSVAAHMVGLEIERAQLAHARREVAGFLRRFTARCQEAGIAFKLLEENEVPWRVIATEAQRFDLILLGRQTRFQFETKAGPDPTLRKMLKESPRPVVVVPEAPAGGDSVLVAYDGSTPAARAVQAFQACGLMPGARVHVVTVRDASRTESATCANRAAEFLGSHGYRTEIHPIVSPERPADELLATCREVEAGLVVMGVHSRPLIEQWFVGSVARRVVEIGAIPVLLYR